MVKLKAHSPTYCIRDNWENMLNRTHTLDKIYLTGIVFRSVCTMMIMSWCYVQANEYDLQAKMYLTICTHHKVHNNNENRFPVFPECICNQWQNMMWQTSQAHKHVLILQMRISLDVSTLWHSLWILDWTCYLRTPLCHVKILYKGFYRGVPGFATGCPCHVWCRGLTTCLLYVGQRFGNQVWNVGDFANLTQWRTTFLLFYYVLRIY